MYNDDTRETYVERRKAENLAQAERSYEINGSHRNIWIFLFQWAMAEEEYGELKPNSRRRTVDQTIRQNNNHRLRDLLGYQGRLHTEQNDNRGVHTP